MLALAIPLSKASQLYYLCYNMIMLFPAFVLMYKIAYYPHKFLCLLFIFGYLIIMGYAMGAVFNFIKAQLKYEVCDGGELKNKEDQKTIE